MGMELTPIAPPHHLPLPPPAFAALWVERRQKRGGADAAFCPLSPASDTSFARVRSGGEGWGEGAQGRTIANCKLNNAN
ncbi:hypothetical protein K227x_18950 [Rubripirellula lacrimiformis]|uniref:Uncharacterized protein n=1 Tax=Rubripirellula lacrimiformis TaxID=1930273 RepID=A0A517N8Q7_9BACT|nr:hypothetical protein K227x_18950 [Rubripirellula lacrimiformis]